MVEGQDGSDTMRFNGAAAAEQFTLSANGSRLRLFRDVGNVTMDTAGVERVDLNALGGVDLVTVNDLSGTDVGSVNVDLAGSLGGTTGDAAVDRVVVNGTAGDDAIDVSEGLGRSEGERPRPDGGDLPSRGDRPPRDQHASWQRHRRLGRCWRPARSSSSWTACARPVEACIQPSWRASFRGARPPQSHGRVLHARQSRHWSPGSG